MTSDERFAALVALSDGTVLCQRRPGDWYVRVPGVELGGGGILESFGESGKTPEAAIDATWSKVLLISPRRFLVKDAMKPTRREVRWNGFMWADVLMERQS